MMLSWMVLELNSCPFCVDVEVFWFEGLLKGLIVMVMPDCSEAAGYLNHYCVPTELSCYSSSARAVTHINRLIVSVLVVIAAIAAIDGFVAVECRVLT